MKFWILKKNVLVLLVLVIYFNWIYFFRIFFLYYFNEIKLSYYFVVIIWDIVMLCFLFYFIERKLWGVYRLYGNLIYKIEN